MMTHRYISATFTAFARAIIALAIIALGMTGIAALMSDTELTLDFVFGKQTWVVWLSTSVLLVAGVAGALAQLIKPAMRYRKGRVTYHHC